MHRVFALVGFLSTLSLPAQQPADLLLHNGTVFTADDLMSIHSAVVVRDGLIVEVGGEEIVGKYRSARVIDLDGRNLRRLTAGYGDCSNPAWSRWGD